MQTTDSSHGYTVAENHLARDFRAVRPAEKWGSDLTYIRTRGGWLYLPIVLEQADRKVVGWMLSETMEAETITVAAFQMAVRNSPPCSIPFCFTLTGACSTPAVPSVSSWKGDRCCKV